MPLWILTVICFCELREIIPPEAVLGLAVTEPQMCVFLNDEIRQVEGIERLPGGVDNVRQVWCRVAERKLSK